MIAFWHNQKKTQKHETNFTTEHPNTANLSTPQEKFSSSLHRICHLTELEATIVGKVTVFDFAIRAIGRELDTENTALFLRNGISDSADGLDYYIPTTTALYHHKGVSLSKYNVISRPWDSRRFVSAIITEFLRGHRSGWNYSDGILYQELGLVVVSNGRHHLTIAKFNGDATADLDIHSLQDSFPILHTDGASWFYEEDGIPRNIPCRDYRLALLYELARKRWEICQDYHFSEPDHQPKCLNQGSCEWFTLCDQLHTQYEELHFLKEENKLLRHRLNALEQSSSLQ